ncbi:hypothetical protein HYH03_013386 [Edaphochlamys debaryana]|uniref:F-box domain-containing protein n=1 Tax=Edaphochlamys debaryana TaxID=47281 RepID=A0A836BUK6_9CHLO|nr:hypothetical protein HYH03_013386 [Edaphochlamys debaryana]|eukprot:KAG2488083.1 hypothetical protein HYH03_013386 [Edaphochlamys debaryana]
MSALTETAGPRASETSAGVEATASLPPLCRLHDSLLERVLVLLDIQSRERVAATCKRLQSASASHPARAVDLAGNAEVCRRYIERAKGAICTITSQRHQERTACDATSARRFSTGLRCTQVVPYTSGPAALRLAACLPSLQHLALHEATSCLGGMTDEFATAVAQHCPLLSSLEVHFTRYSLPSEFFTDAGMLALAERCPRLARISLANCGAITDRSLYAIASHCRSLTSLALGGYHELITDYGTVVLFQASSSLTDVSLSGKLRRVTDASAEALAQHSGGALREVKLTRSMGDGALAALAAHCRVLRKVDCGKCDPSALTAGGVAALLATLTSPGAAAATPSPPASPPLASAGSRDPSPSRSSPGYIDGGAACVRVVLPHGVKAAEVVQLGVALAAAGRAGGGADPDAAARWRAVVPPPPARAPGGRPVPAVTVTGGPAATSGAKAGREPSGAMYVGGGTAGSPRGRPAGPSPEEVIVLMPSGAAAGVAKAWAQGAAPLWVPAGTPLAVPPGA